LEHSFLRVLESFYQNFGLISRHTFLQSRKVEKVKISPKPNLGFGKKKIFPESQYPGLSKMVRNFSVRLFVPEIWLF